MPGLLRKAQKSQDPFFLGPGSASAGRNWTAHQISVPSPKNGSTTPGFSEAPSTLNAPGIKLKLISSIQIRGGDSFSQQNQETARLG